MADYLSVKIRADVYRKIKTLAAWHDQNVGEYLSALVEPVADREMDKMTKEVVGKPKTHDSKPHKD